MVSLIHVRTKTYVSATHNENIHVDTINLGLQCVYYYISVRWRWYTVSTGMENFVLFFFFRTDVDEVLL